MKKQWIKASCNPRVGALLFLALGTSGASAGIIGLADVLDPTVVTGTVVNIAGPPAICQDRDLTNNSVASELPEEESRMGPGSIYQSVRQNWQTTQHPNATLSQIGAAVQQSYSSLVTSRMATPAVTSIDDLPDLSGWLGEVRAVPEPSTAVLLAGSAIPLAFRGCLGRWARTRRCTKPALRSGVCYER